MLRPLPIAALCTCVLASATPQDAPPPARQNSFAATQSKLQTPKSNLAAPQTAPPRDEPHYGFVAGGNLAASQLAPPPETAFQTSPPPDTASHPASPRPATSQPTSKPKPRLLPVGRKAPKFEAYALTGALVRFPDDYAGQLVLLHVWASWCPSCARDYPFWIQAQDKFGGAGLSLLGLSVDYEKNISADAVRAAIQLRGGTWEVIYDGAEQLQRKILAPSLPTLYLVDGDTGKILAAGDDLRRGRLIATLEKHLAAKFPAHATTSPAHASTSSPTHTATSQPTTTPP